MNKKPRANKTNTVTNTKQSIGHDRKFLGAEIGFIDTVLLAFGTLLLAGGGLLASLYPHSRTFGICFFLSGALCFILLTNLHWRNRHKKLQPLGGTWSWLLLGAAGLFILGGVASGLFTLIIADKVKSFSISCGAKVATPGRPLAAPIMVEYPSMYGPTISPVHFMLFVTIVNLQSTVSTIDGYSLEWGAEKDGPWSPMKPISATATQIFWAYDLKSSKPVNMTANGLDFQLKGRQLNSHDTVRGWTLWECLNPSGCSYAFTKFSVRDSAGVRDSGACGIGPASTFEADTNGAYWQFLPGQSDLSNAHVVFMSECCR